MGSNSNSSPHVVLFPFMSKGHTIPILHLARLLLRRRPNLTVTIFTTPANLPFISTSLSNTTTTIISIPFPHSSEIPPGIESTEKLPSMSLYVPFCRATKKMQPEFELHLKTLPPVTFMVSDGFLWWTLESASKFGFPRLVFYGMSAYASAVARAVAVEKLLQGPESKDELMTLTQFPWIKVSKNDLDPVFSEHDQKSPRLDLLMDQRISASKSYGMLVNSFYELEPVFVDYLNRPDRAAKVWCVGPLSLAEPLEAVKESELKPSWINWLDEKLETGCSVLYVAFGSQVEILPEQLKEIAMGLEESDVNFLWVIRKTESELGDGFEERVKGRGIVVREWVDQREILSHGSVRGFLSHCGWNSVLESICAAVPILAWPMMADQPMNARAVCEEFKVGLKVETCDGTIKGFVKAEGMKKMVKELMEGEKGKEVTKKAEKLSYMAKKAIESNEGSSWRTIDLLMGQIENNS